MTDPTMTNPTLAIATLGGTISMQAHSGQRGVSPTLTAEAALAATPALRALADVHAATLCLQPSASLSVADLMGVLDWANEQADSGAQGIIVTLGTDAMEEAAFLLDLLWDHETPLVLTGAMRAATQAGADGPANLLAAAFTALEPGSRSRGVQVVINDSIHSARHVSKCDSLAMEAFASPLFGRQGVVIEGRVVYFRPPVARLTLPRPRQCDNHVALLEASLADPPLLLERIIDAGYSGLVVAGFGAGHVSRDWATAIHTLTKVIPVVIGTRTGSGPTASETYGFAGAEIDLIAKGALMAGLLSPRKARLLMWVLIGCGRVEELGLWLDAMSDG